MADPRFYRNCGSWDMATICAKAGIALPPGVDGAVQVMGIASLDDAGLAHLSFFFGTAEETDALARTRAAFVLTPEASPAVPDGMIALRTASIGQAFTTIAALFYPDTTVSVPAGVDPTVLLGRDVVLGPGAAIAAACEIGDRTRIGAGAVIGHGVTIGQDCEIGEGVIISHAHIGDRVVVRPSVQIGVSASARLGRVILQDRVEVGAACVIERGTLGDTVIGDGSRIDEGVRIGPDAQVGRRCILAAGVGGGSVIGDFSRPDGQDSGGNPAKPI